MAQEKFIWTAAETYARSKGGKGGAHLELGKTYDTADFDPGILAEWYRAGVAEPAETKAKAKKEA